MADVFICHVEEDEELARALAEGMEAEAISVWYYERDSYPGPSYLRQTGQALSACSAILLVISRAAFGSPYQMRREIIQAYEEHKEFIPILVDVTMDDFKARQPDWHSVTGGATAVRLPPGGATELMPRLLLGMQELGIGQEHQRSGATRAESSVAPELSRNRGSTGAAKSTASGPKGLATEQHRDGGPRRRPTDPAGAGAPVAVAPTPPRGSEQLLHPEMTRIPGGNFLFGPRPTTMELPEFWIGRYLVTNAEYAEYVRDASIRPPRHWNGPKPPGKMLDHPVTWVSAERAVRYCSWLSSATGSPYRLPTEEEWEKAARGTDGRLYPWGNRFEHSRVYGGSISTAAVAAHSPAGDSPFGVADMVGNVRQWTLQTKRKGAVVVRGGGPWGLPEFLVCSHREELSSGANRSTGFRLAMSGAEG